MERGVFLRVYDLIDDVSNDSPIIIILYPAYNAALAPCAMREITNATAGSEARKSKYFFPSFYRFIEPLTVAIEQF